MSTKTRICNQEQSSNGSIQLSAIKYLNKIGYSNIDFQENNHSNSSMDKLL